MVGRLEGRADDARCRAVHEGVERAERGDLLADLLRGDVPPDQRRLGAERAKLLGGLLGCGVVTEMADRDARRAVGGEPPGDLAPDAARATRYQYGHRFDGSGLSAGAELGICFQPGRDDGSCGPSSAFVEAWP